jgi:hypothetical protein
MHSIADQITFCRRTSGDVPTELVVCAPLRHGIANHNDYCLGCIDHGNWNEDVSFCMLRQQYFKLCGINSTNREEERYRKGNWFQIYMYSIWNRLSGRKWNHMPGTTFQVRGTFTALILVSL